LNWVNGHASLGCIFDDFTNLKFFKNTNIESKFLQVEPKDLISLNVFITKGTGTNGRYFIYLKQRNNCPICEVVPALLILFEASKTSN
jgi:hypothetical protein